MTSQKRILRWRKDAPIQQAMDRVAIEEPLEIQVETRPVSVTMRTPGHDPELVAGFLLSEGMIHQADDIREIRPYPRNRDGNSLGVFLKPGVPFDFSKLTRHVFASSSCGLCGKASIQAVHAHFKPVRSRFQIDPVLLAGLPDAMHQVQETFQSTGGLHAAGLFDITGKLLLCREDVGRHNAVDKVLGHALLARWLPLNRHILLVSGRASFEILQKALSAQVSILCAVGAPSSLAVDFARASGQTLIGFLREGRFNAYAGTHRLRRIQPS